MSILWYSAVSLNTCVMRVIVELTGGKGECERGAGCSVCSSCAMDSCAMIRKEEGR